ncbi:MAG: hypothetical protein ACREA3_07640 [Nitrosotalea sp.]
MADLRTAQLAGVIMVVSVIAIAGTNLAFAQSSTPCGLLFEPYCTTPPSVAAPAPLCGNVAYSFVACWPDLATAQLYGVFMTAGVIGFTVLCAALSGNLRH